jgi:hypothetical protein
MDMVTSALAIYLVDRQSIGARMDEMPSMRTDTYAPRSSDARLPGDCWDITRGIICAGLIPVG